MSKSTQEWTPLTFNPADSDPLRPTPASGACLWALSRFHLFSVPAHLL